MAKYSEKLTKNICKDLSTGEYRIKDVCKRNDITEPTYYEWVNTKPKFSKSVNDAYEIRKKNMVDVAQWALISRAKGYDYEETIGDKFLSKHSPPDVKAAETILKLAGELIEKQEHKVTSVPNLDHLSREDLEKMHEKFTNSPSG